MERSENRLCIYIRINCLWTRKWS